MGARAFGQYQVLARLATGGAGMIFLARERVPPNSRRLVCLKTPLASLALDPGLVQMFLDEAKLAARLAHPNCVAIYKIGRVRGVYYIAMEYLLGENLADVIHASRSSGVSLPAPVVAGVIASIADGLHYAHELKSQDGHPLNLVHRDVSPQNIMVTFDGDTKILDFGIAKAAVGKHETATGIVKGKLAFMSPEQLTGGVIDRRSDIYSLGLVLYSCLAHRALFQGLTPEEMARKMMFERVPKLSETCRDATPELDAIVERALQSKPQHRFQSAVEMSAALKRFVQQSGGRTGRSAVMMVLQEVMGQQLAARRRVLDQALEDLYDEPRLLEHLNARPVLEMDLSPANPEDAQEPDVDLSIDSDPDDFEPDTTERFPADTLERNEDLRRMLAIGGDTEHDGQNEPGEETARTPLDLDEMAGDAPASAAKPGIPDFSEDDLEEGNARTAMKPAVRFGGQVRISPAHMAETRPDVGLDGGVADSMRPTSPGKLVARPLVTTIETESVVLDDPDPPARAAPEHVNPGVRIASGMGTPIVRGDPLEAEPATVNRVPAQRRLLAVLAASTFVAGALAGVLATQLLGGRPLADDTVETVAILEGDTRVEETDLNGDKRADLRKFVLLDAAGHRISVRTEIDVDFDGRADIRRIYDPQGNLASEEYDFDFDGTFDVRKVHGPEGSRIEPLSPAARGDPPSR